MKSPLKLRSLGILACTLLISACIQVPAGLEQQQTFVQESVLPYTEAYARIANSAKPCLRSVLVLGGTEFRAVLDTERQRGIIELYYVVLNGGPIPKDGPMYRRITVDATPTGSRITIFGDPPKWAYVLDRQVINWIEGSTTCRARL